MHTLELVESARLKKKTDLISINGVITFLCVAHADTVPVRIVPYVMLIISRMKMNIIISYDMT